LFYNHVEVFRTQASQNSFLVYYFRFNLDGSPRNSSGVGNDTASERIMMERYMVGFNLLFGQLNINSVASALT